MGEGRHDAGKVVKLSRREAQAALLVALGKTNKEIAAGLGLGERTAKQYVSNALRKTNCRCRSELAGYIGRPTSRTG